MFFELALLCLFLAILTSVFYSKGVEEIKDPSRNATNSYYIRTLKTNRNFMISSWIFSIFFLGIWFFSERHKIAQRQRINRQLADIVNNR